MNQFSPNTECLLRNISHKIKFCYLSLQKNLAILKIVKFHVKLGLTECQNMPNQIWILLVSSIFILKYVPNNSYKIVVTYLANQRMSVSPPPHLAPEIQHKSECGIASDMFSLGMVMIAAFNGGQSVIQANHSTNLYFKQAGVVSGWSQFDQRSSYAKLLHRS